MLFLLTLTESVLAVLRDQAHEWTSSLSTSKLSHFRSLISRLQETKSSVEATATAQETLAFVAEQNEQDKLRQALPNLTSEQLKRAANEETSAQEMPAEQLVRLRDLSQDLLAVLPPVAAPYSGPLIPPGVPAWKAAQWSHLRFRVSPYEYYAGSDSETRAQTSEPDVSPSVSEKAESVRSQAFEAPDAVTQSAPDTEISVDTISASTTTSRSEPPSPALPEPRFLVGRMTNEVQVGRRVPLQVRIGLTPTGGAASALKTFSIVPGTAVTLDVYSPGFIIRSDATQTIIVPADKDSDWARFELEAKTPGNQTVEVNAWNNGAFLGTLSLAVTVTTETARGESIETQGGLGMRDPKTDEVTLDVQYDPDKKQYEYQLRGETIGTLEPFHSKTFPEGRDAQFLQLITQMNQQAKGLQHYSPAAARDWLIGVGTQLWDDLIPVPMKEAFWENIDKIGRLNIISPADPLPWEMVCPFQEGKPETAQFLADRFSVSRWMYGPPPTETLNLADPYFVLPPDAPASAPVEVQELKKILGNAGTIAQLDALTRLIKSKQFGLLHFATHNVQHEGGLTDSYIPLDGQRFSQAFLGPVYRKTLSERAPLIFMNACTAAGTSPTYTGMTSWANCFLNAGAGAFIGSLWEIKDRSAQEFSEAFYSTLKGGATLANAMRAGRAAISDQADDPTWLAYTLYGNPDAKLA